MSMSPESAKRYKDEPAVLCCRKEKGALIDESSLEEPAILPDLVSSGLLTIPADSLTVGEVLGATLAGTVDALTPLTPELLEGFSKNAEAPKAVSSDSAPPPAPVTPAYQDPMPAGSGAVKISIGSGENIYLEIPLGLPFAQMQQAAVTRPAAEPAAATTGEGKIVSAEPETHRLTRKYFAVKDIKMGPETKLDGTTLYIRESIVEEAEKSNDIVISLKLEIISPDNYDRYSETILDVQPVAAKEGDSVLGKGVTRVLDGVVVMVTGTDADRVQIGEFGSTDGQLDQTIMWGRPGAPDRGDFIIKTEVVIKAKMNMERKGPIAAHEATDYITQEIRMALKDADESLVVREEELVYKRKPGSKKVAVIKEIMGQGAMHDNSLLSDEPGGMQGGISIIDLGNLPVVLTPLEALDGGVHALTCVGPATKETTRHYWREPLILEAISDDELDLAGVVFVGSPQINSEKFFVSERLGTMIEAMDVDGAFIGTEGFGNNHIDFASHHYQLGMRSIPIVGLTFSAVQGALVMGNEYMTNMIELNKSAEGIENEILANNTICHEDAVRAVAMLKAVMAGEEIRAPETAYNPHVKEANLDLIAEQTGRKIERVDNEKVLPARKGREEG